MISYANSIPGQPPPTQLISSLVQSLLKNNKNEAAASFYLLPVSLFQYRAEITYFVGSTLKTVIIHPRVRSCRVVLPPPRFSSSHRRAIKRSVETVSWELRSIEIRAVSSCSANPSSKDDASPCNERSTPVLSRKSSFIPPRFSNRSFFFLSFAARISRARLLYDANYSIGGTVAGDIDDVGFPLLGQAIMQSDLPSKSNRSRLWLPAAVCYVNNSNRDWMESVKGPSLWIKSFALFPELTSVLLKRCHFFFFFFFFTYLFRVLEFRKITRNFKIQISIQIFSLVKNYIDSYDLVRFKIKYLFR